MKIPFREYHLIQALQAYSNQGLPLDVYLRKYFLLHKAVGSKDRRFISDLIYTLIRFKALLDHPSSDLSWPERYQKWQMLDLKKVLIDSTIPSYIRCSTTEALFQILTTSFDEQTATELCHVSNETAPTTVRVNILKISRDALFQKWQSHYPIKKTLKSPWGITFEKKINFFALDEFKQGLFEIQDEGSQLVADMIEVTPKDQVLDFCAGSGGKTLAFAHKMNQKGQIYLHDTRSNALEQAKKRLRRAGIQNAQFLLNNSHRKKDLIGKMDWVLVDAPCSGTGTYRRNPDLKWKFSTEMLEELIQLQRKIVEEALAYLTHKGTLVYATCSILTQENEEQIAYFEKQFHLKQSKPPFRTFPVSGGMDGFFAACLQK